MSKLFTLFLLLLQFAAYSQSKKDLQSQIDSLDAKNKQMLMRINASDEKHKALENELKNIQINLTNTTTTLSLVSKSNLDLEAQVKSQSQRIQKLMAQNDSLLHSFTANGAEEKFIVNPQNETDSIIYVIQNYYKAKKWEDRLQYVINADKVKPLMADAYKDQFRSGLIEKSQINVPGSHYETGKTFKVFVSSDPLYLAKTDNGFKLDWEATTGYNEKTIAAFNAEKSGNAAVFRTWLSLNSSYWDDLEINKSNYLSLRSDFDGIGTYISLTNSKAAELKKILEDGKNHQVIVEVQFKTFTANYGTSYEIPIITKFIKAGWDK